ncbi:MGMT family protein [Candidatus Woesearchaeota archaeon]|nr:MGMT family protein [Candidatus Woesearchaeota archaeon]
MALLRPFHHAVAQRCFSVPEGKVTTYADIARSMGMSAYRAVGMAMKRNPCAPVVPCHRVVASDGSIGGWSGGGSKEAMLQKEGVLIRDGRVVDFERKRHAF